MERWTSCDESGYYHIRRIHGGKYEPTKKDLIQRVGQYEDTGLEPEEVTAVKHSLMGKAIAEIKEFDGVPVSRLQKLAQAEQAGRLVVLPCAIGDRIYRLSQRTLKAYEVEVNRQFLSDGEITIFAHPVLQDERLATCYEVCKGKDFGKTVFLTREETEAALKGEKHEANPV